MTDWAGTASELATGAGAGTLVLAVAAALIAANSGSAGSRSAPCQKPTSAEATYTGRPARPRSS